MGCLGENKITDKTVKETPLVVGLAIHILHQSTESIAQGVCDTQLSVQRCCCILIIKCLPSYHSVHLFPGTFSHLAGADCSLHVSLEIQINR